MMLRPPTMNRTDTLLPYTTLCRSAGKQQQRHAEHQQTRAPGRRGIGARFRRRGGRHRIGLWRRLGRANLFCSRRGPVGFGSGGGKLIRHTLCVPVSFVVSRRDRLQRARPPSPTSWSIGRASGREQGVKTVLSLGVAESLKKKKRR